MTRTTMFRSFCQFVYKANVSSLQYYIMQSPQLILGHAYKIRLRFIYLSFENSF
jgi:hypothetical protein